MSRDLAAADDRDEAVVAHAVANATRRARLLIIGEALASGVAAGAFSPTAGVVIAVTVVVWRSKTTSRSYILRRLERAHPNLRNLFVTAAELLQGDLSAPPTVRSRVFTDAAAAARRIDLHTAFPIGRLARITVLAAAAWAAVLTVHRWREAPRAGAGVIPATAPGTPASRDVGLHVRVTIQPPQYTSLEPTTVVDPEQLQAIAGSGLVLTAEASGSSLDIDHDGRARTISRGADGRFTDRLQVTHTGYVSLSADEGARRTIPLVVRPDALPAVRLTAPGRDLVYAGGNARITFSARATDDFGLRSLVLRYTKVTGSGENFEFKEGEIPLSVQTASARDWAGTASRSLTELDLKEGDMLVYRAVAADQRPGDGSASSDTFFVEISRLGITAGDAFTLPEEQSKYALSQQMLIVKTERLHQRRGSLAAGELAEQTLNLAVEQRMIRAEFVFMLGGEINDEEVEAEQSTELQAGRLQNRGQRDLRAATIAMSQAEKLLTGANTAAALVAERAAVAALQHAFARDRYILRALATRSQLDPARRLTGALTDATGWHRVLPDLPANRRAALLQDLLRGIAELIAAAPGGPSPPGPKGPGLQGEARRAGPSASADADGAPGPTGPGLSGGARRAGPLGPTDPDAFRQRALVLAEEAIRIDPAAASLREVATQLQRAAVSDRAGRSTALAGAVAAASAEATRSHADPPRSSTPLAPALSGAFADALSKRGQPR